MRRARPTVLLVFVGQLVHAENRDDVLQFLVALEHRLHAAGHIVMLLADDERVELARGGIERVHRGVNTEGGDIARQHHFRVEVGEGGRRRRVGEVVRGNVDRLDRGDRSGPGGGDALLQGSHLFRQRRLVAHRRRHPAEQRRHLGAGEGVTINVVNEEQHVAGLSSRNFSAMVNPLRPTRRRLPGGSFIWPYTIDTFDSPSRSMTPDSCISW